MTDLKRLADLVRGCDMLDADRDYLATLLRSAAGETVGTLLVEIGYAEACNNRNVYACRLALVAARKERDEARADAAWWMDTVREVCNHVLGNDRWDPRDRAVGTPIVQAVAAVRKERDEAAKMAYMILPSDDRNPGVTWREAYEMLDEKFLGEKHGHDCAMSTIAEERAALQRAIDEAIIFVEGHLTDENRRKLLAATLRPHATPSQPERAKEPKVDHLKPLIERHEATLASLREISEGVKRMIDTPPLPTEPQPAPRPCDCRELVARLTECVEALASRRVFPHFLRDIIRDARGGGA